MSNKTLMLIKPRAVKNNCIGMILNTVNENNFRIAAMKMLQMTKKQAREFYIVHKDRSFYEDLVDFMTSGAIVAVLLEKENAVEDFRTLIGPTNPKEATEGTIRYACGYDIQQNAVHGSDSPENAERECNFFFPYAERF
ncbi:MAG: nucleoside-diphosphate kinase [Bacteroidales bacterium]|nr:nucleoside-diphosphate kinase [Bacteroidales bacterium]MCF8336512.1 nucleoside-diphosphate kinase [Bacteroidales bacterium]